MPVSVYIAWGIYAAIFTALVVFNIGFTKYYQSLRDSELSVTMVTAAMLSIAMGTVALVPLDIFLVSNTVDRHTGLKKTWADEDTIYWMTLAVQVLYYVFFGLILVFSFFIIPFSYIYYESGRRAKALKYSFFFGMMGILLYLFGLFLKPTILPPHIDLEWFKNLLMESSKFKSCVKILLGN
ncbi:hypothetical protein BCV71DRAFT_25215 [Rhizopus microsporus]|uniref:Probable lysosomal cobalamin transporter n=1 Tax=Rhizopus microsporus TaxID=58291 RepID=A0A1X0RV63_RHIZD|nr:hypothetical protein BCV71DRAFT_25215 [Rhizopus microsporus]